MPATLVPEARKQPRKPKARKPARKEASARKLSRTQRPPDMSLEDWQVALRRDYGLAQDFHVVNLGSEPIFSDFAVTNPQSGRTYRVAIRGQGLGESRCSCPDFATNTLGTCKHVEFVLGRIRRQRGGKSALRRGWQPPTSEVWLRQGARRQVVFRPGADAPPTLRALAARFFEANGVLKSPRHYDFDEFLQQAGSRVRCDDDVLDFIARVRDTAHRELVVQQKYADDAALEGLVKARLYPYQCEGVRFAAEAGRALLGDEMGLGKTIQAIALAELMARDFGVERVLVVCPATLKHQWKSEIEKFSDRSATVVEGLTHQRALHYATDSFFKIVNYDVLHRDLEVIARLAPDLVILDEAQRIKNWRTRAANAVKSIASPYALVLTGTPLENRLEELYSIVQFVDQQRLGPLFRFIDRHQVTDGESARVIGYRSLQKIGETLRPILLRRRKREVLEQLPERSDKTFFVPMTGRQQTIHAENAEIVARIVQKWKRLHFLTEADQLRMRIALQRMRMCCDDAFLIDHQTRSGQKVAELAELLAELLEDPETRVVIFSQWTRMHDLVREMLEARGWKYAYLHGGVPSRERKALVARFREPDTRLFLSTDAGGTGLNLQHASVVINLDLPWNPAVLEQRIGRVHRLGQQRNVRVVNYVAEGTIEQGMLKVLGFKKSLFAGVLDGGDDCVALHGSHLERFMETVETVRCAVPEAPPPEEPDLAQAAAQVGGPDAPRAIELPGPAEPVPADPARTALSGNGAPSPADHATGSAPENGAPASPADHAMGSAPENGAPASPAHHAMGSAPENGAPASPADHATGSAPENGAAAPANDDFQAPAPSPHPPHDGAPSPGAGHPPQERTCGERSQQVALQSLFQAGAALLHGLGAALGDGNGNGRAAPGDGHRNGGASPTVSLERDESSGQVSLRVALPQPEVLERLVVAAGPLLDLLRQAAKV